MQPSFVSRGAWGTALGLMVVFAMAVGAEADPGQRLSPSDGSIHVSRLPQGEPGWASASGEAEPLAIGTGGFGERSPEVVEVWLRSLSAATLSSPRLADVDGDGVKDIVVATYDPVDPYSAGRVYVIDVAGNDLPGWPVTTLGPVPASPAVADIDNDGDMEVIVCSWQYAYVWNHDGTDYPGWPKSRGAYVSPAIGDLDGDSDLEIVYAGSNRSLYVWHHNGTALAGWPFASPELVGTPAYSFRQHEIVAGTLD